MQENHFFRFGHPTFCFHLKAFEYVIVCSKDVTSPVVMLLIKSLELTLCFAFRGFSILSPKLSLVLGPCLYSIAVTPGNISIPSDFTGYKYFNKRYYYSLGPNWLSCCVDESRIRTVTCQSRVNHVSKVLLERIC